MVAFGSEDVKSRDLSSNFQSKLFDMKFTSIYDCFEIFFFWMNEQNLYRATGGEELFKY